MIYAYDGRDMLSLILLLILGSGLAYLALQNTAAVTVTLLNYTFPDAPLFSVILGSMLIGVLLAYIIYLANSISTALTMHGKDNKIKESENDLTSLTKKTHQLELENESLKKDSPSANFDDKSL